MALRGWAARRLQGFRPHQFVSAPCRAITLLKTKYRGRSASYIRSRALFRAMETIIVIGALKSRLPECIIFGKRVVMGPDCTIGAKDALAIGTDSQAGTCRRGVWLGAYSMEFARVTIGESSIVADGVVVPNIPPGVPCR
jgi:acetyltransferase-like isoleucine patch superfamily enzyme